MSVSISRHHADWLSLVEVSGPFVSLPVLLKVFPQGLESRDPAQAKALRAAYDEWQDNPTAPGRQRAWVLHVLTALLGYPANLIAEGQTLPAGLEANVAEMGETLRPDFALVGPSGTDTAGQAQLLITSYPSEQALDHPVLGKHWKANPATRMTELLHAAGVPLGLVTNGEQWMLVFAPRGETTGYASWFSALWLDEPITLRAFHSLLGVRRFFGVAAESTLLGLLKESVQDQQEVTDQLGYQVRQAVQFLVQAFDTLDQDSNRTLLKGVSESVLYEAALTVMMRLVFLFSAEERGLLHLGKPLYDDNYAVSTLLGQLQEVADLHGPQVLERRFDAWARLLATFRAVHGGVHHQDLLMPAYGGSLFDPDRFPFLEGRDAGTNWAAVPALPLAVNNRVALHLLTSLQRLRIKVPGGGPAEARRVSFRALGVEQIGHVYEGLLDHTALRATETVLGIKGTRDKETEIALTTLEAKLTQGQDALIESLKDETGRSVSAIRNALEESSDDEHNLLIACRQDKALLQRVRPFAGLIREDSFEHPLVILPGSVYVTAGTTRRSTGTHYTPPSLTEPIVHYTLEPLVYQGPAEGLPREQWQLKSPKEILNLKVCDMAMGSGAFLVQACRYLAERLTEAWENEEQKHPGEVLVTPEGEFSQGSPTERLIPQDPTERLAIARRIVADRCLYGVDINPMAVEMAKLSLWLVTLDAKRPFTFLDHAFKCGDSLLGLSSFKQLEDFSLRPEGGKQFAFSTMNLWRHIEEAKKKREALEAVPSDTPGQIAAKGGLYAESEHAVAKLKAAADVLLGLELRPLKGHAYEREREDTADTMMARWQHSPEALRLFADQGMKGRRPLHWPLDYPEIMEKGGFDAFVGNPPFLGGARISGTLGDDYLEHLLATNPRSIGNADLSSFFLRRIVSLQRENGVAGMISTNSIAKGETRESGLQFLIDSGVSLFRATKSQPWPGTANVFVSIIHLQKGTWRGQFNLDGKPVRGISSFLDSHDTVFKPFRLSQNLGIVFRGPTVGGEGFILTADEALAMARQFPECKVVIEPFLTGQDINQHPEHRGDRFVINFGSMDEAEARQYVPCWERLYATVRLQRLGNKIKQRETYWWRFIGRQEKLYEAIHGLETVLACGEVSKYWGATWIDPKQVFAGKVVVFALRGDAYFTLLNSCFHVEWAEKTSSRLKGDPAYSLAETFETMPFPEPLKIGRNGATPESDGACIVDKLSGLGAECSQYRLGLMKRRNEGLTATYNRFHDPREFSEDIVRLRTLHVEMDEAVAAAYGWSDLIFNHGFHEVKQGMRFTISEVSRREVLDRLLALNLQRHAEEEAEEMNLFAKRRPTAKRGRNTRVEVATDRIGSFDFEGAEHE